MYPEQEGTLTSDEKYVVAAWARLMPRPEWRTSEATQNKFRMLGRFDITVAEWDGEKQGEDIISYASGRITELEGNRVSLGSPFDNASNRQYKNLLVSSSIAQATTEEMNRAYVDLNRKLKNGEPIQSGVSFIENASEFIGLAVKNAVPPRVQQKEQSTHIQTGSQLDKVLED